MAIYSCNFLVVLEFDRLAGWAGGAGKDDLPATDRSHRSAGRSGIVNSIMGPVPFQDRMVATPGEARGNAGEFERRCKKCLPHRLAIRRKEFELVAAMETKRRDGSTF